MGGRCTESRPARAVLTTCAARGGSDDSVPTEEMRVALEEFWEAQRKEVPCRGLVSPLLLVHRVIVLWPVGALSVGASSVAAWPAGVLVVSYQWS